MTTETTKASESPKDDEQSTLPTVLAGAGILAVAALLIFWPSGDDSKGEGASGKAAASAGAEGGGGPGSPAGRAAGVGARSIDAPTTPAGSAKRNPAIKLPAGGRGMAEVPEALPKDPAPTATHDEKIEFYEKRLDQAIRVRDTRKKFVDRLPQVKARVEASDNPAEGLQAFEKRKKIVDDNYAKALREVEEIEGKLAELRGG